MTATFAELNDLAARHLSAATQTELSQATDAECAQILAALRHCLLSCHLLWRTVDRTDRRFTDPDPAWQRAGQHLDRSLTVATRCLQNAAARAPQNCVAPAAARLDAASVAIGASHDLLATHTLSTPVGLIDRSGVAAVIDSPDGRRAVAAATAAHLQQLLSLTDTVGQHPHAPRATREAALRAGDALHTAMRALRSAGILAGPLPELLPSIPLVEPLRLQPVRDGEAPNALLAEAVRSAERLHRIAREELGTGALVRHTPGALATVAVAISTTHQLSAQAFRQLAPHVTALLPGDRGGELAARLQDAAAVADQAGDAWADARVRWRGLRAPHERGAADVIRREATDLTIRMGRLVHTDPHWLPRLDADARLRTGIKLAPDPTTLSALLGGIRQLSALATDIGVDHVELTAALYRQHLLLVRTRDLPDGHDSPRPWSLAPGYTVHRLVEGQHRAATSSRQSWSLNRDLTELVPLQRHVEQITLEGRRLAITDGVSTQGLGRYIP
jgi:hypothetical protein